MKLKSPLEANALPVGQEQNAEGNKVGMQRLRICQFMFTQTVVKQETTKRNCSAKTKDNKPLRIKQSDTIAIEERTDELLPFHQENEEDVNGIKDE